MKLSPFLLGVISAQSGDYSDVTEGDDRHYGYGSPGGYDDGYGSAPSYGGDSGYYGGVGSSYGATNYNYGYGKAATAIKATAVTCWESNNMGSHTTHHQHMYDQTDEYGWAHTHHGHETAKGTVNVVGGVEYPASNTQLDYHSELAFDHRLSGCIYEVAGWDYNANTYNRIHTMTYGTKKGKTDTGYDLTNGNLFPVWWHYFNAHTMAGGNTFTHKLVMANPTYEGLGYLNFIVTFLASGETNGPGDETDERNPVSNDNNLEDKMHTDLYSNGDAFTLSLEEDVAQCSTYAQIGSGTTCFASKYPQSNEDDDNWTHVQFAISSFPHNDLGKDFRFNLRMLHHLGEGDSHEFYDSYYFYRVNEIIIQFPTTVGCPFERQWDHASNHVVHKCMDSAAHNGHNMWHMGTEQTDPSFQTNAGSSTAFTNVDTVVPKFTETLADTMSNASKFTYICKFGTNTQVLTTGKHGFHLCGDKYTVTGLMNMYDEHAQQEYGTHQEIWFQFYYKYQHTTNDSKVNADKLDEEKTAVYNYPNKLFNAFEVTSVTGKCNYSNVFKKNKCNGGKGDGISEENWANNVQNPN